MLWPTLVLLGGLPIAFIQRSLATMTDGLVAKRKVEIVRVRHWRVSPDHRAGRAVLRLDQLCRWITQ